MRDCVAADEATSGGVVNSHLEEPAKSLVTETVELENLQASGRVAIRARQPEGIGDRCRHY